MPRVAQYYLFSLLFCDGIALRRAFPTYSDFFCENERRRRARLRCPSALSRFGMKHQLDSAPASPPLIHSNETSNEMPETNKMRCHKNEMSQIFRQFVTEL
jgi:hypothetical protein